MYRMVLGRNQKRIQTISGIVLLVIVVMLISIYFLWIMARDDIDQKSAVIVMFTPRDSQEEDIATENKNVYSEHGFRVEYGEGWTLSTNRSGEGDNEIFTTSLDKEEERVLITVMPSTMEGMIREAMSVNTEESITLSNITAQRIEGTSTKDGSAETVVILTQNGTLYSIRGSGVGFNEIVSEFELL